MEVQKLRAKREPHRVSHRRAARRVGLIAAILIGGGAGLGGNCPSAHAQPPATGSGLIQGPTRPSPVIGKQGQATSPRQPSITSPATPRPTTGGSQSTRGAVPAVSPNTTTPASNAAQGTAGQEAGGQLPAAPSASASDIQPPAVDAVPPIDTLQSPEAGLGGGGLSGDLSAALGAGAAAGFGAALADASIGRGSYSAAPNMTGDLFGMGGSCIILKETSVDPNLASGLGGGITDPNAGKGIYLPGPDVATRRVKLSENFSPEVRDRCFLNYNYFNNAIGGLDNVNRWTLGLERLLVDDLISIETRLPMASTLQSTQDSLAMGDRGYELGNLTLITKGVLFRDEDSLWTAGMGVTAPLADDSLLTRGSTPLVRIENQAVHLLPFIATLQRLNSRTLIQAFAEIDVDTNGNPVYGDAFLGTLPYAGRLNDSTLLMLDFSLHRLIRQNPRNAFVRQVIGNAELHYTGSLENADVVRGPGFEITDLARRFNIVNATFSQHWVLANNVVVTPGIAVPLTSGTDKQFDFEAILQLNYFR